MATSSSFLTEDQFMCSICLDVFTEPVSVPCGHNFCKACISRHWKDKERCQCPLCNEKFDKGLKLCVNTGFREVVENFKKHHMTDRNDFLVKEGQVPCDCCLGDKYRASKTCLVCLTSYCDTHLEPHQKVPSLMRHELTDPVQNLEDKICKKHNRILEDFCRDDLPHVCVLCTEQNRIILEKEYEEKKAQNEKMSDVQVVKLKRHKKAQKKKKLPVQTERENKDEAIANSAKSNLLLTPNEQPYEFNRCPCCCFPGIPSLIEEGFVIEVRAEWKTGWYLVFIRQPVKKTSKPNSRKGNKRRFRNNSNSRGLHNVTNNIYLIRKPDRVWVFVDYDVELVSFYDADTDILLHSFIGCKLNDKIALFFSPGPTEDCVNCVPMFYRPPETWMQKLRRNVQKIKDLWAQSSDVNDIVKFTVCICVVMAVNACISKMVINSDEI